VFIDFIPLAEQCAPLVEPVIMEAIIAIESNYNPYAIGVVGGYLKRQPKTKQEAIVTAKQLEKEGFNFSMGLSQVNYHNLQKYNLTYETVFNPCANLSAGSAIYKECFDRASLQYTTVQQSMYAAFSCYYSGNFKRGFVPDSPNQPSYVQKVSTRFYELSRFLITRRQFNLAPPDFNPP
jgi:type IV secretion system protein VirB1